ncbi:Dolichyl-diphosphooligosaccharide-protein glycosyltransferase subunit dad1 [Diaporthe eres]
MAAAYFEQQREALMGEIAMVTTKSTSVHPFTSPPAQNIILTPSCPEPKQSFEQVLANINKLNRNLEAVITVGNEFSSVEALWSTFENVMAKEEGDVDEAADGKGEDAGGGDDEEGERGQDEIKVDDGEQDRTST